MAVFHGTIRSSVLAMDTGLSVILPYDRPAAQQQTPCKTLYLLHGLGDNHQAWCRYTAIETYARDWGIAVVMPEVQRSFYGDMALGLSYFTYITQELPGLCREMFRLSTRREDTFVAGLSMGGYGALKCGLRHPELYAGCASFSGLCDLPFLLERGGENEVQLAQLKALFGPDLKIREEDQLFHLAGELAKRPAGERPAVFFTCGQQDFLYEQNVAFHSHLQAIGYAHAFHEWEGDHVWSFWDTSVRMALEFFFQ